MDAQKIMDKLEFNEQNIDWLKGVPLDEYIAYAFDFLGMNENDFIKLFNSIPRKDIKWILLKFTFVPYVREHTSSDDRVIRPLSLIFFVEGIAPNKNKKIFYRFFNFFKKYLDYDQKKLLIFSYQFYLDGQYKHTCVNCSCSNIDCQPSNCEFFVDAHINTYLKQLLSKIYEMRCSIVHDGYLSSVAGNIYDAYWSKKMNRLEQYHVNLSFDKFKSIIANATVNYLKSITKYPQT